MRARALEFTAPRAARIIERDLRPGGPADVTVRTLFSGISSGTELLVYRGEIEPGTVLDERLDALTGSFAYPVRYGYSCVGIVEDGGAGVPDGAAVFCFHPHQDVIVCDASEAIVLPDGVDARIATLFPLVETALQISLDAGVVAHEVVLVSGLGVVGTVTALLLQRAGAVVLGIDPDPLRRALAVELDVDAVAPAEASERIARLTQHGARVAVEASGRPEALAASLPLLAHEGTALVASWYGSKEARLDLGTHFHRRRLTIRSTQVSSIPAHLSGTWTVERRRQTTMALLRELPLKKLATHDFPFESAPDVFAALDAGDTSIVHAALSYEER